MPNVWTKKGLLFDPTSSQHPWFVSHAALPVVDALEGNRFRVYFSGRDAEGRARIGYVVVVISHVATVVDASDRPVVELGPLGAFDDSGTTSACLVNCRGQKYLYYSGWTLGKTVPFYFFIGLAISDDGGATFRKVSPSPILGRDTIDPYMTASPSILVENGVWRMWYVSGTRWALCDGKPKHYYHIKYAESKDGIQWERTGRVCIDYANSEEYAIARPHVLREDGIYKMWFSHRGPAYRLGYAESTDGLVWDRDDGRAGLDVSPTSWDADMVEYPCVFSHLGTQYMLYNGNGYGQTGIGYAVRHGSRETR